MKPLGYMSQKESDCIKSFQTFNGQTNSIETNDVKHPHQNALSDCFNRFYRRAGIVLKNLTALNVCSSAKYSQKSISAFENSRPTDSTAFNISTSYSSLHYAGLTACYVDISLFTIATSGTNITG